MRRQLSVLGETSPRILGAILLHHEDQYETKDVAGAGIPVLGDVTHLDTIVARARPDLAIVSIPAVMTGAITTIRTRLRRLNIPDRFIATLEDQINGVGPRSVFEVNVLELLDRPAVQIDEAAIRKTIRGKRVLITGAGGSIGSELSRIAARFEPRELFLMERSENALFEIDRQIARNNPRMPRGAWLHDVTDAEKTLDYCVAAKPEVIFHTAAHKHVPMMEEHPELAVRNNFFGTRSIADAAAQTGCERFVMISTDKAVNPSSIMGATKRLAEIYIQYLNARRDTTFEIVRFGNVIGSAGSVLPTWIDQIREGGPVTVTHPEMTRFFMTIPEAASLVVQAAALENVGGGDIAVLDMGEPISILGLIKKLIEQHGLRWVMPTVPPTANAVDENNQNQTNKTISPAHTTRHNQPAVIPIVFTGIRPGEKLHEELVYRNENVRRSPHPSIRIWKSSTIPGEEMVGDMVATLAEACQRGDAETVITSIVRLVPEMQIASRMRCRPKNVNPALRTVSLTDHAADALYRTGTINKADPSKVA